MQKERLTLALALVFVVMFMFFVGVIVLETGMIMGKIPQLNLVSARSYGYFEKDDMWNRIRVDNEGKVICSKE